MKKLFLLAGAAMIGLTGCSTFNQGVPSGALQEEVTASHVANVSVGEKISGESSAMVLFGFLKIGGDNKFADGVAYAGEGSSLTKSLPIPSMFDPMAEVKSAAAYKAVTNSGAAVIVAPVYKTAVKNNYIIYKELEARVEGYKGTITGFTQRPAGNDGYQRN